MALRDLARALDAAVRPLRDQHYLVLPRQGLAYGRIPKAANSSVKRALHQLEWPKRDPNVIGKRINRDRFWAGKNPARAYLATPDTVAALDGVFTFTVVRSPFARIWSCYRDKVVGRSTLQPALAYTGFRLDMTFDDFVRHACSLGDWVTNNHLRGQVDMLGASTGVRVDFVCRVESLHRDWAALRTTLRGRLRRRLPALEHMNRSATTDGSLRKAYADPALVALVRQRYADDFEQLYPDLEDPA